MRFPSGSIDDVLSRVNNIASSASPCSTDIFAAYTYLGDGTIVGVSHPAVSGGLNLTYGSPSDSCGGYAGLDRFGRVIDQKWQTGGCSPTVLDEYSYGYDLAGNRSYRENTLTCGLDELYAYDALGRLTGMERGTLTETNGLLDILCSSLTRGWTLDQLGNWQGLDTDGDSQPDQTRTHDAANKITTIDECSTGLSYDAAGNMTGDGTLTYKYDAWNRLTEADQGANVVATYRYDGLNRRVSKAVAVYASGNLTGYDRTDYQYDEAWQVLEERFAGNQCSADTVATAPHAQYVWDIRYVDAPVLRLRDTAGPSCSQPDGDLDDSGDELLYYTNDANMNVTALVNTSGEVVERYAYEAYGASTILNGVKDAAGTNTSTSEWDERTVATFQNEILNNGYRYNYETGNNQVRRREYSSTLGRWLQPDPAGYVDGMSVYEYAKDAPANYADPSGLRVFIVKKHTTQHTGTITVHFFIRYHADNGVDPEQVKALAKTHAVLIEKFFEKGDWSCCINEDRPDKSGKAGTQLETVNYRIKATVTIETGDAPTARNWKIARTQLGLTAAQAALIDADYNLNRDTFGMWTDVMIKAGEITENAGTLSLCSEDKIVIHELVFHGLNGGDEYNLSPEDLERLFKRIGRTSLEPDNVATCKGTVFYPRHWEAAFEGISNRTGKPLPPSARTASYLTMDDPFFSDHAIVYPDVAKLMFSRAMEIIAAKATTMK